MEPATFLALALACAPAVHIETVRAIVAVESAFNPFAIGVVGGVLERQPASHPEAVATARSLAEGGWSYSVGLGQINVANFARLGLDDRTAFEPCKNLRALQAVLIECYGRASPDHHAQPALRRALSCYYSGDFQTGRRHGYVARVVAASLPPNAHAADKAPRSHP